MHGEHIVFVGAGAVGGYVGGHLARAGCDVTLIDPWPEHIDCIQRDGLHLEGTQGDHRVRIAALHITEAQSLIHRPVDVAFICTKLYDTEWAAALIKPYLASRGYAITMQNGLVEQRVAGIIGWGRTLGCIASTISVEAVAPGRIVRTQLPGGDAYTVFRVGELHGEVTARAEHVAQLLRAVDSAKVTTNLWGERWSKLVANTMSTGTCGVTGLNLTAIVLDQRARRVQIRLAAEAIRVGEALGFKLVAIRGLIPEKWVTAAGDRATLGEVEGYMLEGARLRPESGCSSTAQDIAKGRRTEVDFMNGYIATRGAETGIATPTHATMAALIRQVERGEIAQTRDNLALFSDPSIPA